jgi:hypothetical protein
MVLCLSVFQDIFYHNLISSYWANCLDCYFVTYFQKRISVNIYKKSFKDKELLYSTVFTFKWLLGQQPILFYFIFQTEKQQVLESLLVRKKHGLSKYLTVILLNSCLR